MAELDMSVIDGEEWAQEMWAKLSRNSKKSFLHWCNIVLKLGLDEDSLNNWSQIYIEQVDQINAALVADVSDLKARTCEKIEELLCQLQSLCVELHQPMPSEIGSQGLSLFEEKNRLVKKIEEYQNIISSRKAEIDALCTKQISYCKSLGKEPKRTLQSSPLPTPEVVREFKDYIEQLEEEKFRREEKFFKIKEDIELIVEELQYIPTSNFERLVLSNENFLVTKTNMDSIELFYKHLKEQLKSTSDEISHLRTRIEDLWRLLEIDIMEQAEFRNRYTGKSLVTLEAMRREVKRLEEIRKGNMRTFIEKLRRELNEVWTKCHCSEEDKKSFCWYNCDTYTEDLLCFHELEIQKWKQYYDENAKLLGMIEKDSQLWERAIELEKNATNSNRYQNRGGKLLQEEKERNKLSKLIPNLEKEIRKLATEFEERTNQPFCTNGLTVDEFINHFHSERENNRKEKLSARKERDNTKLTPARSALNIFPSNITAVTPKSAPSAKRKILATPSSTQTKKPRTLTATPASEQRPKPLSAFKPKTSRTVPKIRVLNSSVTTLRQKREKRRSSGRLKKIQTARRLSGKSKQHDPVNITTNTTYSDFESILSENENIRSTLLTEQLDAAGTSFTPRKRTPKVPKNTPRGTPMRSTPRSPGLSDASKLSTCKNNLKLLF